LQRQQGQAIVLIAIVLAALVGMVALAVDGARAYALRRDIQAAVDAAALAAGDKFQSTGSYSSAEQAATSIFGTNLRLYSGPSCSPGYGSPGASPYTLSCTYSDGTVLTQTVYSLGAQGSQFTMTATRSLDLQFARILTNGASPQLGATSSGGVNNRLYAPTIAALNQSGCGGIGGSAININGFGTLNVNGDLVTNGAINATSSVRVTGDVYARCQSSVSNVTTACFPSGASTPCTYPDVAGAARTGFRFVDPNYAPPSVTGGSQPAPGNTVDLNPGSYSASPVSIPNGRCYFLSAGVYRFLNGYTNNGGLASNELKPPEEPLVGDNTQLAPNQFWNTDNVNCAGFFTWTVSGAGGPLVGTWGVELTSVRTDVYNGVSYQRESAPSRCKSLSNIKSNQFVQLTITNVPGAQSYNIYMSNNGCTPPFGMVYNLAAAGPAQNNDTSGCPTPGTGTCSLGTTTITAPAIILPSVASPDPSKPPGTLGAYPPDRETNPMLSGLPNMNPGRGTPPAGDHANENHCQTSGGALTACPGPITPGAVVFYLPSGSCLNNTNNGDTYVFSGYQYNWVSVYEPGALSPPQNSCSNYLGANTNSAFIGLFYAPAASITVTSQYTFESSGTGGLIADTFTFNNNMPRIVYDPSYAPGPPATRLVG
jgi:hypothetical protein